MKRVALLQNAMLEYDWGSRTALGELQGDPTPSDRPYGELWMGAHPRAPSQVVTSSGPVSLIEVVRRDPESVLGPEVARRWGDELPFLLKVLAADQPLSLQAHPGAEHAAAGFERESRLGIPLDAPRRSYRDPRSKPELICALTPFYAMKGFRPIPRTLELLEELGAASLEREVAALRTDPDRDGLARFFRALLELPEERRLRLVAEAGAGAAARTHSDPAFAWVLALCLRHPDDPAVLAPLLLNTLRLEPGEALFLEAGEVHAYLRGLGVELMGNSDNVLRGGLTRKHVDVPELMRVLRLETGEPEVLRPRGSREGAAGYATPAESFALSMIRLGDSRSYASPRKRNVEILLCTEGEARIETADQQLGFRRGQSLLVPAAAGAYEVTGEGATLFMASVPKTRTD